MGLLRFFLAFSVVNVHSHLFGINLIYADVAVQSFYIISGFYMAMILNEKYNRPEIQYSDFILSRFFRIFPAYFLIFLLTIIAALIAWFGFSLNIPPIEYWQSNYNQMTLVSVISVLLPQISIIGLDVTNFIALDSFGNLIFSDQLSRKSVIWHLLAVPQGWTLALEFYFYLLAPFIVRRSVPYIIGIMVASFLVRVILAYVFDVNLDPWTYRFFPSEVLFFLAGTLAYRLSNITEESVTLRKKWYLLSGFLLIVFAGLIARYGHKAGSNFYFFSPILMGLLFLSITRLFALTKYNKIDRYIGELSYPIYISHMLVIWLAELVTADGTLARRLTVGFGSILLAALIYEFLDKRVDEFRHRKFSKEIKNA